MTRTLTSTGSVEVREPSAGVVTHQVAGGWRHFRDTAEVTGDTIVGAGSTVLSITIDGERWEYRATEPAHDGKVQDGAGNWWAKHGSSALGWLSAKRHGIVYGAGDQSAKLQELADISRGEGGLGIWIDPDDDPINVETRTYIWDGCGPVLGAGRKSWIHNTSVDPAGAGAEFWDGGVFNIGTYLGHVPTGSVDGVHDEASYELNDITAGDEVGTLVTAGDASNVTVGDIVAVMDPNTYGTTTFERAACLTEVTKIAAGVLSVAHPFKDDYSANGATKVSIRVLNTGVLNSTVAPGAPALELARNPVMGRLRLSQARTYYGEVLHLNAYGGRFFDLDIEGAQGIGGNPIAFSTFDRIRVGARYRAIEFAYLSHDSAMRDCAARRIGDGQGGTPSTAPGSQPLVSFTETGGDWLIDNLRTYNYGGAWDSGQAAVDLAKPRMTMRGGSVVNSTGPGVFVGGTNTGTFDDRGRDALIEGVTVIAPETDGIDVRSNGARVRGNRVIATPTGRAAIRVASYLTDAVLEDNDLCQSDGTRAAQDRIEHGKFGGPLGTGVGIRAARNRTIYEHQPVETAGNPIATADNGSYATEAEIHSYPLAAATTMRFQGFEACYSGTFAGTVGNKRWRLTWGGTGAALGGQIEVLAAVAAGAWKLSARVQKITNALVRATITLESPAGTQIVSGTSTVNTATTMHDLGLNMQVLGAGDTIALSDVRITPFKDQVAI